MAVETPCLRKGHQHNLERSHRQPQSRNNLHIIAFISFGGGVSLILNPIKVGIAFMKKAAAPSFHLSELDESEEELLEELLCKHPKRTLTVDIAARKDMQRSGKEDSTRQRWRKIEGERERETERGRGKERER